MKILILTALAASLCLSASPKSAPAPEAVATTVEIKKGVKLTLEIADNDALREKGLSGRRSLDWDRGVLFVFPESARRSFWMIDCHFDIDIAYLSKDGVIREILPMRVQPGVPMDQLDRYPSATADIAYALETNRGWFQTKGVKEGDTLRAVTRWTTRR
jgi:uncharacterized protein